MKLKIEKHSPEWNFFGEFYRFVENFHEPEDNDSYWESLSKEAIRLGETYKGMAPKLVLAFLEYQEDLFRKKKQAKLDEVSYQQMKL